jgi:hypothetical protein
MVFEWSRFVVRFTKFTLLLIGLLACAGQSIAQGSKELFRGVSARYSTFTTYEFEGTERVSLPGTDCTLEFNINVAAAIPDFAEGMQAKGTKLTSACLAAMEKLGSVHVPGDWSHFRSMGEGVLGVIALPDEVVKLTDQEIHCVVMDVQYDDYYRKLRSYDGPVRYWVDSESNLIRKVQFAEMSAEGRQRRGWLRMWLLGNRLRWSANPRQILNC